MPTFTELEDALVRADAAGDVEAARALVGEIDALHAQSQQQPQQGGIMEDYVAPAVRGLGPTGIGAAAGAVAGSVAGPAGALTGARVGATAVEGAMLAGDLGTMAINQIFKTRFTGPTEAWQHALTEKGLPESTSDKAKMVEATTRAIGSTVGTMGFGSLIKGATAPGVAKLGQILSEAPKAQLAAAAGAGAVGEYARQVTEEMGGTQGEQFGVSLLAGLAGGMAGGRLAGLSAGAGAAANPIIQAGIEHNINLSTSMINQPKGLVGKYIQTLGSNIPFLGTGGNLIETAGQRPAAARALLESFGVDMATSPDLKRAVTESLTESRAAKLNDLVAQKKNIIDPLGQSGAAVPVSNTTAAINAEIKALEKINPDAFSKVIGDFESFKKNIQGKTLDSIEGNRAVLRDMFKNPELATVRDAGEKAMDRIYGALRQDMGDFIESNLGKSSRTTWHDADVELAKMFAETKVASLKSVLRTGAATPEVVAKMLFSQKESDLDLLLNNLNAAGKQNAKMAVLQEVANRATNKITGELSASAFQVKLNELGKPIAKLFDATEKKRIESLGLALEASKYAELFAPNAPTGIKGVVPQSAILMGAGALGILGKAAAVGLGYRAYESKMMRNLLERIASNPPEKAELVKRATTALQVAYVRQIGNEMIQKGQPITFVPNAVQEEKVGQGSITTDMTHGYRAVSTNGKKQRLYGPDNQLLGVFSNIDQARQFADQRVVKAIKPSFN